ncbi:MAG: hypothetical protein ABI910_14125 [Gemmatimonadota bacterium]
MPRAFVALWAFWLTAVLSNPAALHTCPTHRAAPSHQAGSAKVADASHAEHAARADTGGGHDHGRSHDCTCLGLCCCVAPAAALVRTPQLPTPSLHTVRVASFTVSSFADVRRTHVQPFANGPPLTGASL